MEINKKENLIAAGFKIGTVQELLELSEEEMTAIENKIQEHNKTKINKKYTREYHIKSGILLDADSLLNDQEHNEILPND
jgi:chemotaxis signal transduction protein